MGKVTSSNLGDTLSLKTVRGRPQISSRLSTSVTIMVIPFNASDFTPVNSSDIFGNIDAAKLQQAISSPIGYIQDFTPTIGRDESPVYQIGQHAIVEIVPSALKQHGITIGRTFLYKSRMVPVFGAQATKGNTILMNYRPFNIIVVDKYDKTNILNGFWGCWMLNCDYKVDSKTFVMVETMKLTYSWVT